MLLKEADGFLKDAQHYIQKGKAQALVDSGILQDLLGTMRKVIQQTIGTVTQLKLDALTAKLHRVITLAHQRNAHQGLIESVETQLATIQTTLQLLTLENTSATAPITNQASSSTSPPAIGKAVVKAPAIGAARPRSTKRVFEEKAPPTQPGQGISRTHKRRARAKQHDHILQLARSDEV